MTHRPVIKALLTAVAMGAALTVGSIGSAAAVQAPAAKAAVSSSCRNWKDHYSQGRWTYSETRLCLNTDGQSVWPVLQVQNCQYYWGSAWYNANNRYPCTFDFHYDVKRNGNAVIKGAASGSTAASGEIPGTTGRCQGAGAYKLTARYEQHGPYWTDWPITVPDRTEQLNVPCGS
ncbi:hypothetical protein [Streptomyces sp. NBC_01483]|uniref:hypothetical protein n=1 Tax=Streptomyces sp. NBC_01483 TaxID=2903883 RepID=UPI002E35023A|nr:hypothetical protein [Streptomyces sp. NBC_01483]